VYSEIRRGGLQPWADRGPCSTEYHLHTGRRSGRLELSSALAILVATGSLETVGASARGGDKVSVLGTNVGAAAKSSVRRIRTTEKTTQGARVLQEAGVGTIPRSQEVRAATG